MYNPTPSAYPDSFGLPSARYVGVDLLIGRGTAEKRSDRNR